MSRYPSVSATAGWGFPNSINASCGRRFSWCQSCGCGTFGVEYPQVSKVRKKKIIHNPAVSVIIPSYNGGNLLINCLESIPPKGTEIIVVDNGSADASIARARRKFPSARFILLGHNTGFAYACNRGAAVARGSILLFLNQDAEVVEQGFRAAVKLITDYPRRVIATGKVIYPDGRAQEILRRFPGYTDFLFGRKTLLTRLFPDNKRSRHYLYADIDLTRPQRIDACAGMCMFVRRDIFTSLRGFDEGYFFYTEDIDLCRRVYDAGYETWYVPEVSAVHIVGENVPGSCRTFVKMHHYKGLYRYLIKHKRPGLPFRFLLWLGLGLAVIWYLSEPRLR
ncbi:glycosyltransferase [candidate division WOR-3 bacterium]|uniref:Glycosyltransferase n=1 Tax=candidate division WOR-3 bacterium TaxID=2052148 RepID=A0A9D5K7X3_UNCW3|nr:glycosyltransferase [candidate division WOR-3 bacterium]MBD3364006.1 glycosyltransferase [candidate division WOR-3 bacterium]